VPSIDIDDRNTRCVSTGRQPNRRSYRLTAPLYIPAYG